jgi:hypothetical protein
MSVLFSAILPALSTQGGMGGFFQGIGGALGGNLEQMNGMVTGVPRPLYHYSLPLYAGLTLILYFLATWLIQPIRRWRLSWRSAGVALALLVAVGGGTALTFLSTADRYTLSAMPTPVPFMPAPMPGVAVARPVEVRVAPTATTLPLQTPVSVAEFSAEDQVSIYMAVAAPLIQQEAITLGTLYLVRATFDVMGYVNGPSAPPQNLSPALQDALAAALSPLAEQVTWINEWPASAMELADEDRVLVLGNLHPLEEGILASATLFRVGDRSMGGSYLLTQENDKWVLTGEPRATWSN